MLKSYLHNKPSSEKQREFFFVNVACNGEGRQSSCPGGLTQETPPTLTPSLKCLGEKKFVPAIPVSKPLDLAGDWAPLAL